MQHDEGDADDDGGGPAVTEEKPEDALEDKARDARRDEPQKSNERFLEVLKNKTGDDRQPLRNYGDLREMVDEALDRNARNNSGKLPPVLERFRYTPGKRPGFFE